MENGDKELCVELYMNGIAQNYPGVAQLRVRGKGDLTGFEGLVALADTLDGFVSTRGFIAPEITLDEKGKKVGLTAKIAIAEAGILDFYQTMETVCQKEGCSLLVMSSNFDRKLADARILAARDEAPQACKVA